MSNIVNEVCSTFNSLYKYKDKLLSSNIVITFLNIDDDTNYSRDIRCKYEIDISKNNNFNKDEIEVILLNLDYIVNEVLKEKILKALPKYISEDVINSYEYKFDIDKKTLIITMEYRIINKIDKDHNNHAITEFIINTLLDAAKELR